MPAATDPTVVFFDKIAEKYDGEYSAQTPGGYALRIRRKKVLDLFDQPGRKVLDVGCGPAVMTEALLQRGCAFWGVDPSSEMINIARKRFKENNRVQFVSGDAMNLEFPDSFFDAVLCMGVIDAVRSPRRGVREMVRVMKPGGTLIMSFTNLASLYSFWKKYAFYPAVSIWHGVRDGREAWRSQSGLGSEAKRRNLFTASAAQSLLVSEGLSVVQIVGYYYNVFLSPLDEIWPAAALWATRKVEEGNWQKPSWLAAGWIVKASKEQAL